MKFWQYTVGCVLAIFVFAAALLVDYRQYSEYQAFANSPFLLMEGVEISCGGDMTVLPSGEFFWKDEMTEIQEDDTERRLLNGTVILGGTFFATTGDLPVTNRLWFGNASLFAPKTVTLVSYSAERNETTIITTSGTVELFLPENEQPFVIPAHSQMTFNAIEKRSFDTHRDYFALKKLFGVQPILESSLSQKLFEVEQIIRQLRKEFQYFAWNLPLLWSAQKGSFLQFLEDTALILPPQKQAFVGFQKLTQPLRVARDNIDNEIAERELRMFKTEIMTSPEWKETLKKHKELAQQWEWFVMAQKIWLPLLSADSSEYRFSILWNGDKPSLSEQMKIITRLAYEHPILSLDETRENFMKDFREMEFMPEDVFVVTQLRRCLGYVLETYQKYKTTDWFESWATIVRKEQELLSINYKKDVAVEVGHDILNFVSEFLHDEEGGSITRFLNELWFELPIPESEGSFSAAEKTTIEEILLVRDSGMTPKQMRVFLAQKAEKAQLEDQLRNLEETSEVEEMSQQLVANAKELWEYLAKENVKLDLTAFRTTRTEEGVTTRFANTATGKRKIEGVFDYPLQMFITLTLGEESIADLPVHHLGYWLRLIAGKFESTSTTTPSESPSENVVVQTAPQAILGKRVVQTILRSIGFEVRTEDLEMLDMAYEQCAIKNVRYDGITLNALYNLVHQKFTDIVIENAAGRQEIPDATTEELERELELLWKQKETQN